MDRPTQRSYQTKLVELRKRLIQDVNATENALREDIMSPGGHAASRTHPGDQDSEGMLEQLAIAHNEEHLLEQVEAALERLEEGTFGTCKTCRRSIARERLAALPFAAECIDCARLADQS